MDTIYSQSQEIFNSDKISSLQHAKMNDTDSVPHVSNIISHLKYTNKIGIEFLHFTSNPSRHTMTMESASHPSLLRRDAPSNTGAGVIGRLVGRNKSMVNRPLA